MKIFRILSLLFTVIAISTLSCSGFIPPAPTATTTPTWTVTASPSATASPTVTPTRTSTPSPTPISQINRKYTGADWELTIRKAYTLDQFRDFASVFSEEAEYVQPPEDKVFIVLNLKLHTSNPIIDRYVYPDLFSIQDETGAMIPSFGLGLEQFTFLMGGESFCAECGFELDDQGDMGALVVFTIDENKADQVHQLIFADLSIPFTISE